MLERLLGSVGFDCIYASPSKSVDMYMSIEKNSKCFTKKREKMIASFFWVGASYLLANTLQLKARLF